MSNNEEYSGAVNDSGQSFSGLAVEQTCEEQTGCELFLKLRDSMKKIKTILDDPKKKDISEMILMGLLEEDVLLLQSIAEELTIEAKKELPFNERMSRIIGSISTFVDTIAEGNGNGMEWAISELTDSDSHINKQIVSIGDESNAGTMESFFEKGAGAFRLDNGKIVFNGEINKFSVRNSLKDFFKFSNERPN